MEYSFLWRENARKGAWNEECSLLSVQVESAGRCDRAAVGDRYHTGRDEIRRHSHQPDHHSRHAGAPHRPRCVVRRTAAEFVTILIVIVNQVVKYYWRKAALHVVRLLRIKRFLSLDAVINDWMIPFAAYTPSAFQWAGQATKLPLPESAPQTASRSVQPFLQDKSMWPTHRQRPRYVRHL